MRLVRKVNPTKWRGKDWASIDRIPSDALTQCMKTSSNTLSFWRIEESKGEEESILALLGTQDRIDKIDIAFIEATDLLNATIDNTPGKTVFAELCDLHVDVANLDHLAFINTAKILGIQIFANCTRRLSRADFKTRMQTAVNTRRIAWESIPESMQKELIKPSELT